MDEFQSIIGTTEEMRRVLEIVRRVSRTSVPVLIRGESGTGKELIAQAIHKTGVRSDQRFVALNSAALPDTLLEGELFGVRRGAFTGANEDRKGLFEVASGGTLFFDEVGNMSPLLQTKLLRAFESGEVTPVGGTDAIPVDVRIIAATSLGIEDAVGKNEFRADLLYRLNVVEIHLPPLRHRKADIPMLIEHFVEVYTREYDLPQKSLSPAALAALTDYPWPGNVRELENVVQRVLVLARDSVVKKQDVVFRQYPLDPLPSGIYDLPYEEAKDRILHRFQRSYITRVLKECNGNVTRAAARAQLSRLGFRRILKRCSEARPEEHPS